MAHNKIIAIISFGYDRFFGVENVTYNLIQQITKLDKKNKYLLFVNEHVQGLYSSSDNIKKIIVKKMASTQILKTLWLILFYPLISFIKRINITLVINGSNNFSLSPFTKNIIYIHDLGDLYIKNKYDIKRMLYIVLILISNRYFCWFNHNKDWCPSFGFKYKRYYPRTPNFMYR